MENHQPVFIFFGHIQSLKSVPMYVNVCHCLSIMYHVYIKLKSMDGRRWRCLLAIVDLHGGSAWLRRPRVAKKAWDHSYLSKHTKSIQKSKIHHIANHFTKMPGAFWTCLNHLHIIYLKPMAAMAQVEPFNKASSPPPEPDQMYALSEATCRCYSFSTLRVSSALAALAWEFARDLTCLCSPSTWTCLVAWRCGQVRTNLTQATRTNQTQIMTCVFNIN